MDELHQIFKQYEGSAIEYRGRLDDMNNVIRLLSAYLSNKNQKKNREVIFELLNCCSFIKEISFSNDQCCIDYDDKSLCFSFIPDDIKLNFGKFFFDKLNHSYCFYHQCHSVTSKYLELNSNQNICAVTSLCIDINHTRFFHSYIWNKDSNLIFDFSRNIVMNKDFFDKIFVDREINVFDYQGYLLNIKESNYICCGRDYCRLLYLALYKLYNEKYNDNYGIIPRKCLSYYFDSFLRNVVNKGL